MAGTNTPTLALRKPGVDDNYDLKADYLDNWDKIDSMATQARVLGYTASNPDSDGIYTVVQYYRPDATLYMKSTLTGSGDPLKYTTDTWQIYDSAGVLVDTIPWAIGYDESGNPMSKTTTYTGLIFTDINSVLAAHNLIGMGRGGGGTTAVYGSYTATADGITHVPIGISSYNSNDDILDVKFKQAWLDDGDQYINANDSMYIDLNGWSLSTGEIIKFRILKNIKMIPGVVDGALVEDGSLTKQKLTQAFQDEITNKVNSSDVATVATANKILKLDENGDLPADITGNAATATDATNASNATKVNGVYLRNNGGALEWSADSATWNSAGGGGIDFEYGLVQY